MSILGRKVPLRIVAGLIALLVLVVVALLPAMTPPSAREIRLVARGMAFYLEGDLEHPNPVVEVRAGETVRVVLTNDDRGISHDFVVPAAAARTDLLRWSEHGEVVFAAPSAPGIYAYLCNPHQLMMQGTLKVVAP